MRGLKFNRTGRLFGAMLPAILVIPVPLRAADPPPTPPAPEISALDQAYLMRVVRRAIEASWTHHEAYEPPYIPESLRSLFCRTAVTLRRAGRLRGIGSSTRRLCVPACLYAAREAAKDPRVGEDPGRETLGTLTIGIELMGEIQDLDAGLNDDAVLRDAVDPGLDGLGIRVGDRELCLTPGDMIAYGLLSSAGGVTMRRHRVYPPSVWLRTRAPRLRTADQPRKNTPPEKFRPFRFRSTHFHESTPQSAPVFLRRGMVLIPPGAVTAKGLDQAIDTIGEYLHYRQIDNGLFSYEYRPEIDQYADGNHVVRQAGALWAFLRYARWSGRGEILQAATRGIEYFGHYAMPLAGRNELLHLGTLGGANQVGLSALYTLTLVDHPDDKRFTETRRKFVGAMLTLQQKNGMILDIFPPAPPGSDARSQAYAPGKALLALARWHLQTRLDESPVPRRFAAALPFYRSLFREKPMAAFVPWHAQAFALMAHETRNDDYAAFVFEMIDWLAAKQLTQANCPSPELHGGIATDLPGWAGSATATYLEGFTGALALARQRGDRNRAEMYETVVRRAARFVLQLMVRPQECYYILSPPDAVGGIRTTPVNHRLRIDHCQHALLALMSTRELLFEKRKGKR